MATITALNVYPVKSCRGIPLQRGTVAITGLAHDREWMIVRPDGRFTTQREEPALALIETGLVDGTLTLSSAQAGRLEIPTDATGAAIEVSCFKDRCAAFDMGEHAAQWLQTHLRTPHRLVRFDPARKRPSNRQWTGEVEALNQFSDGYPFMIVSQASLDDLNTRLPVALPMNRFRPNVVIDGVPAYTEDRLGELSVDGVTLRGVKPCARCSITTTNQTTAEREGDEPLRTLHSYRFSRELKGVLFGRNAILLAGAGRELRVGQTLELTLEP